MDKNERLFFAFLGHEMLARGTLIDVTLAMRQAAGNRCEKRLSLYVDHTGAPTDVDLDADDEHLRAHLDLLFPEDAADSSASGQEPSKRGRGRPKLGVASREVSLLPRHWEWLATQPSGASASLRRLIDAERKRTESQDALRSRIDAAHRFLWDIGGDLPGFEEASRALYAHDFAQFEHLIVEFPVDVQNVLLRYVSEAKAVT
jgi:hypothetical protein